MEEKLYYVYEWIIKQTGEIFYIGKGTGNRCNQISCRNEVFKKYYYNNDCEVRILEYFENEQDAFNKEAELIQYYHSIGQAKASLDNGGTGGCHFVWTDEMRKYQSEYNPMKRPEQRERMSKNNPMKDPKIAERVAKKNSKPVYIDGVKYPSVTAAANELNHSQQIIIAWCRKGYSPDGKICRYEEDLNKEFPSFKEATKPPQSIGIYIDDNYFITIKAAAQAYNFAYPSFSKKLKENNG